MKIGIDLDSVLNELETPWLKWIQENLKPDFTLQDWNVWAVQDLLGPRVFEYLDLPGTFRNLPIVEGAQRGIQALKGAGHELFVVTACVDSPVLGHIIQDKLDWLKEHFPQIPHHNVMFTSQKHLVDVELLIDDGPHNILAFPRRGIIFDKPWNQDIAHAPRAFSWEGVVELVSNPDRAT